MARYREMKYSVEIIAETKGTILGEGPHWDAATETLYFVDIMGGSINSYKPCGRSFASAVIGDGKTPVTLIIPVEGEPNKFLISVKNDLAIVTWDGKCPQIPMSEIKVVASADRVETQRINDGKADSKGRVWAGTMHVNNPEENYPPVGALYRFQGYCEGEKILTDIHISNGLTWNACNDKFYYIDSSKYRIESYPYNETGDINISEREIVFDFKETNTKGLPDGMTIDEDGYLYVATYGAGRVLRIDPKARKIIQEIKINDAEDITSVAFGGKCLDELYVTTAKKKNKMTKDEDDCVNGYLYRVTNLGAVGLKMFNANLNNK